MKNIKPQPSIFARALSEAVKDFAEEMGQSPAAKNEVTIMGITRKMPQGAVILRMSKQPQITKPMM